MRIWNTSQNWIQNSHNMHPFCSHHNLGSTCHHPYYISYQIKTTCPKKITEDGQVISTSQQVQIMEYPIQTSHSQTQAEWLLWSPSVSLYQWHWHSDNVTTVYAAGDMSSGLLPLTVTQLLHNLWWCLTDWSLLVTNNFFPRAEPWYSDSEAPMMSTPAG